MLVNIRFRSGVVGETARVVHAATGMTDGTLVSLCGMTFDQDLVEESRGMPCMRCVQVAVRLTAGADPPQSPRRRQIEHGWEEPPRR